MAGIPTSGSGFTTHEQWRMDLLPAPARQRRAVAWPILGPFGRCPGVPSDRVFICENRRNLRLTSLFAVLHPAFSDFDPRASGATTAAPAAGRFIFLRQKNASPFLSCSCPFQKIFLQLSQETPHPAPHFAFFAREKRKELPLYRGTMFSPRLSV